MKHLFCILAAACLLMTIISGALAAELPDLTNYNKVFKYIQEEKPMSLDMGDTKFSIDQLRKLKDAMPEGSEFHFNVWFRQTWIDSRGEIIDLDNSQKTTSEAELLWLLENMPNVRQVNLFNHREFSNDFMVPLMEKYPDVTFGWQVRVSSQYVVRSDATAFSTNKESSGKPDLTEKHFENLKYVPGLKAIDIGHNAVKDVSWLRYFPELNILILADNQISDISPLADLHELEYLEMFMNYVSDLSPLAGLENLRDLNVSYQLGYAFKDVDLSVLDGLNLERFWCNRNGISEEEQQRFKTANPETLCDFTGSHSTDHDWRKSYKYDQFRVMFRNRVWAPFTRP